MDEKSAKSDVWDIQTYIYDEKNKITYPRLLAIATEIKKTKFGNKVLELGCGLGVLHEILGEEYQYYGCDVSYKVVRMHNNPNIVQCDLDFELPFKELKFDYVVCSGVIEYLSDVKKFLLDLNRCYSHESCLFLITISNSANLWDRISMLRGHFPNHASLWKNFFSLKDFLNLLSECQFKVLKYYPSSYIPTRHKKLTLLISRNFPSLFGAQFLFLCEKKH